MKITILNYQLEHCIESRNDGRHYLYNQFGYAGNYATLKEALSAHEQMSREPAPNYQD